MSSADLPLWQRLAAWVVTALLVPLWVPPAMAATEDFTLEMEDYSQKNWSAGGFVEIRGEHMSIRQDSAATLLNLGPAADASLNQATGSVQLNGAATRGMASLHWLLRASGQENSLGWKDTAEIYESYLTLAPALGKTASLGKKSYKWGKGYAWNPVGFINQSKDPNNPEEALEGYVTAEAEWLKSLSGPLLQNVALTTVLLPVERDINEDFGAGANINMAARLTLLFADTDIDWILYTGNSKSTRFGVDFSRNVTSNFEIHGELAHIPWLEQSLLTEHNQTGRQTAPATSALAGIRYLNEHDLTTILEWYHNAGGYSEDEMSRFYDLISTAEAQRLATGSNSLALGGVAPVLQGFVRPYPGRDYLYLRLSQKEPFNLLYFTPAVTTIFNVDDQSFSLAPELTYTGFTNWELLLRFSTLAGSNWSEFGEKQNSSKLELRVRYYY